MPSTRPATEVRSREAIGLALEALHAESVAYWDAIPTAEFLRPIGDAWSPADNVRHLSKSIRAVTRGLRLPTFVVRLSFGGSSGSSRTYEEIREHYRASLGSGASAGVFAPTPSHADSTPDVERARIMSQHAADVQALVASIGRWSERQLDRCQLPHPLLGPLTVREMLFFTLYHNRHHLDGVRRRRGEA